jgi:hypothetical protein
MQMVEIAFMIELRLKSPVIERTFKLLSSGCLTQIHLTNSVLFSFFLSLTTGRGHSFLTPRRPVEPCVHHHASVDPGLPNKCRDANERSASAGAGLPK